MLTNKQNQLLNFLILSIEKDGVSPSYEEICLELNLKSKSGIHRIVKALEERGYIEHLENKARAIAPTKYPNGQPYIKLQPEHQLKQFQIMTNLLKYLKIIYFPKKALP